mmetsp:Transcript_32075/g.47181  ORF Transcript_32075/g.47181 Transcript_32075/m.47181 type:complete len:374 (+) Transcript_32075:214-1335(+)
MTSSSYFSKITNWKRKISILIFTTSSLCCCHANLAPLALHQLYEVSSGGELVLALHGYDLNGDKTLATITKLPTSGKLYQLSYVYNKHGYDPKAGVQITSIPCNVTGDKSRLVYKRPAIDQEHNGEWDRFDYTVSDGKASSRAGIVTLIAPSRLVVASDFRLSSEGWSTIGNRKNGVSYEPTSRGVMNRYIYAADNSLNIGRSGDDEDLWYFVLPQKFTGWHGIMYGGSFEFILSSFSGDFSDDKFNFGGDMNLVEIYCERCDLNKGVTIAYPLSSTSGFSGSTKSFSLGMTENEGWLLDPENTLLEWTVPTKCDFIEVISGITSVRILGDFTNWYESVSIDSVNWRSAPPKGRKQLLPCAQGTPDARGCTCK